MWELNTTTSHDNKSMRRIFTFFFATVVAAFVCALISTVNTFALEASWKSTSSISYENNTYTGPVPEDAVKNLGLTAGSKAYTYVDPTNTGGSDTRKIRVIFFEPDANMDTLKSASYKTFTYNGVGNYSSPSGVTSVAISEKTKAAAETSCAVDGGLGWIICPVTNFLANGMDWIFEIIKSFMIVRPVSTNQSDSLYRAWSYMRSFANVAFVIAFIVIIYSQITNYGISNYGVKKLLPRLIIAAILVNISYFICAIAVDISNILGSSLQEVFISIRNGIVGTSGNSWDLVNWKSITGFVLSGGTMAAAGTIALVSTLSTYGVAYSIFLLLPTLLVGLMAVLVSLAVMAARQALVTILIVLSPLAFVAYLLPNTEKWFEKWKSTFYTMLILFPAFSVIFGGSQLASSLIIQNADSINTVILALIIQVVPLFITPFLVKMSGSIVGKVAGFVNNPSKGPIDRSRKFIQDRADVNAAKRLGQVAKPYQFLRQHTQRVDHNRRRREGWKSSYGTMADARWSNSGAYSDIDQNTREYQERKSLGEARSELRYSQSRITSGRLQEIDVSIRETKLQIDNAKLRSDINWESNRTQVVSEARLQNNVLGDQLTLAKAVNDNNYAMQKTLENAKNTFADNNETVRSLLESARGTAEAISIQGSRKVAINKHLTKEFGEALLKSEAKQNVAGAYEIVKDGGKSALASAISVVRDNYNNTVKERSALLAHFNTTSSDYQTLVLGGTVQKDADGNRILNDLGQPIINEVGSIVGRYTTSDGTVITHNINTSDEYFKEAAIDRMMKVGIYPEKRDIIESSGKGGALEDYASSIAYYMAAYGVGDKAPQLGGSSIGAAGQGEFTGHKFLLRQSANLVADGKIKTDDLANNWDTPAIADIIEAINSVRSGETYDKVKDAEKIKAFQGYLPQFFSSAQTILDATSNVGRNASAGTQKLLLKFLVENNMDVPEQMSSSLKEYEKTLRSELKKPKKPKK